MISIVTWFKARNYGTALQAYALYRAIEKLGFDCQLIYPFDIISRNFSNKIKNVLGRAGILSIIRNLKFRDKQGKKIVRMVNEFNIEYIYTEKKYNNIMASTSVFITGSDQIWNPSRILPFYLLDFVPEDKKCISYASSIGVNNIPDDKRGTYKRYLSKFSHISLREQAGVEEIRSILHRDDVIKTLDPTFLLSSKDWIEFADESEIEFDLPNRYILIYLIGNRSDYLSVINNIRRKYEDCKIIVIASVENRNFIIPDAISYIYGGPKEFVKLLINSTLVVTDSFHACALSINNEKQFVVMKRFRDGDNNSQNSRIYDLLNSFGLENRLINDDMMPDSHIDYSAISQELESRRQANLSFLKNAIED